MRYQHIYGNKWLDLKPEELRSDGVDSDGEIVVDKHAYPTDYRDGHYLGKRNSGDMSNRCLDTGFYNIVFRDYKK